MEIFSEAYYSITFCFCLCKYSYAELLEQQWCSAYSLIYVISCMAGDASEQWLCIRNQQQTPLSRDYESDKH